jgi:putative hydrolase of HD superfamily
VADHSFRMAVLSMLVSDLRGMNTEKILRMAILHDLEESATGDIATPEKKKNENAAKNNAVEGMKNVLSTLPNDLQKKYFGLWKEQEFLESPEARLLKEIDQIEMMLQAREYEMEQPNIDLESFWTNSEGAFKDKEILSIFEKLKKMRK